MPRSSACGKRPAGRSRRASRCARSAAAPTKSLASSAQTQPRPASSAVRSSDEVVAVERVADLEPQRVARAQPGRRGAGGQQARPTARRRARARTSARRRARRCSPCGQRSRARRRPRRRVKPNGSSSGSSTSVERRRPLQRQHRQLVAAVVQRHAGRQRLGQPFPVGVDPAGVDDQQQVVVGEPVGDQVVDGAAARRRAAACTGRWPGADPVEVVGERALQELAACPAPRSSSWPMCETSNTPACARTARCSGMMPSYCTGISQPAKGTIRAPAARWRSWSGVRRRASALASGSASLLRTVGSGAPGAGFVPTRRPGGLRCRGTRVKGQPGGGCARSVAHHFRRYRDRLAKRRRKARCGRRRVPSPGTPRGLRGGRARPRRTRGSRRS